MNFTHRLAVAAATILLAVTLQQFADFPLQNAFTGSLSNWLHVPMFTCISLVLLWLGPPGGRWTVLIAVVLIALGSEGLQLVTPGQASVSDLARDALGATIAWWSVRFSHTWITGHHRLAAVVLALTLSIVAALLVPSRYLLAYQHQAERFPELYQPADPRGDVLLEVSSDPKVPAAVTTEHPWQAYAGKPVLDITWAHTRWPGVHLLEPVSDWRDYDMLVVDVYNTAEEPQSFTAAVRHRGSEGTARYYPTRIQPGPNRLYIPLQYLALLDNGEPATITHVILHTDQKHAGQRILLGRVWLQKSPSVKSSTAPEPQKEDNR